LESSHRDGSNGTKFISLASIDNELILPFFEILSRHLSMLETWI